MLETFEQILDFFSHLLIRGIFISVLVILFAKLISRNRIETDTSFQIIRWTILVYAFGVITSFIFLIIFKDKQEYLSDWTNKYWWSLLIGNSIIPLTLLNKKLSKKTFYILLISLLMNHGWLIESFLIHIPAMFRDLELDNYNPFLPNKYEVEIFIKGTLFGLVSLIIGNSIKGLGLERMHKS